MKPVPSVLQPTVSVVVLNHRRPQLLERVLRGIAQLDYPAFEIVVIGDQPRLDDYELSMPTGTIRYQCFTEQNICAARNRAIQLCGGEIIAFCDDDAVPAPDWLNQIAAPFAVSHVGAVGGTVLGSDGVSVDWQGGCFDRGATEYPLAIHGAVRILDAKTQNREGLFASLMGANSAFRAKALRDVGGFDEAYRYYLDETDIALRVTQAGWSTAFARDAIVYHFHEQNAARGRLRTPRNLFEIAASKAYFCKQHLPKDQLEDRLLRFRDNRRRDFDPYIRLGLLRGHQCKTLCGQIDAGLVDGLERNSKPGLVPAIPQPRFQPFAGTPGDGALSIAVVSGWGIGRVHKIRRLAERLADAGHRVSCFSFMTGTHPRTVTYRNGVWLHRGGTWRMAHRRGGAVLIGRNSRAMAELERVTPQRRFDLVLSPARRANRPQDRLRADGVVLDARLMPGRKGALDDVLAQLEHSLRRQHAPARLVTNMAHSRPEEAATRPLMPGNRA